MAAALITPQDVISIVHNEPRTTSLKVAEAFGKLHKDVLRKIEGLDCSEEFASAHFYANARTEQIGSGAQREFKYYEMTKDGFMFLVMGFTGKKAAQIKEAYINAFNWMAAQLFGTSSASKTTADERSPLRAAVSLLVGKRSLMYPEAYALVHQRFSVEHIDQLTPEQTTQAVEYVHRLVLEGEVLPAAKVTQPLDLPSIEFPHLPGMIGSIGFMTAGNLIGMRHGGASPIGKLLRLLGERGYDTAAMKVEYNGLYHALESFESCLERIARETDGTRRLGMRVDFRPVIVE